MAIGSTKSSAKYLLDGKALIHNVSITKRCSDGPPNPIGDVKGSVGAEGKEVVGRNSLRFASALQHEELWQDSNGFQIDRERPEDLQGRAGSREASARYDGVCAKTRKMTIQAITENQGE
jgi:hypothetical protein